MSHLVKLLFTVSLIFLFISCSTEKPQQKVADEPENPLKGKWRLLKVMSEPDTAFREVDQDSVGYYKVLTDKTFIWYIYDKKTRLVTQTAGGSYTYIGESYTEEVEFGYPSGTGLAGSNIPFKCERNGDKWHHSGYVGVREYDEEVGDYVVLQENRLEEVWLKVE